MATLVMCVCLAALLLIAFLPAPSRASTTDGTVEFYVFNNPGCSTCKFMESEMLPSLEKQYGSKIKFKYYDMSAQNAAGFESFRFMINLENSFHKTEMAFPQVYIDSQALIGPEEVKTKLPPLVADYAAKGGVDLPVLTVDGAVVPPPATSPLNPSTEPSPSSAPTPPPETTETPVYIAYFYKSGCRQCDAVSVELNFLKEFGSGIHVQQYDMSKPSSILLNEAMCLAYGVPKNERGIAPSLFVGHVYLHGKDLNRKKLTEAIATERTFQTPEIPWEQAKQFLPEAKKELKTTLSGLNVFTVMGAGLVDGLNPCALTVIIFLVAYLAFIGKTGKETIYVGVALSVMAFLTYLLVGLGLLSFIRVISGSGTAGTWITAVVASFTALFGVVSIYDYAKMKASGEMSSTLGLTKGVTQRIHRLIREHTKTSHLVVGAAILGILITIFELGCTGQVYLPVITFVARSGGDRVKAVIYLILFSAMSTLPLVVVFLLTYFGTSNEKLAAFGRKHMPELTLLGGVAMLALAVILFVTL